MTTERSDNDIWDSESGCDEDDEDCLDGDEGSGDSGGGYWDRMTTSGSRTSKSTKKRPDMITFNDALNNKQRRQAFVQLPWLMTTIRHTHMTNKTTDY